MLRCSFGDRGSFALSRLAYFHRDRFVAYAFVAVPYMPPNGKDFNFEEMYTQAVKKFGFGLGGYQVFLCEPDAPQILFDHVSNSIFSCSVDVEIL